MQKVTRMVVERSALCDLISERLMMPPTTSGSTSSVRVE